MSEASTRTLAPHLEREPVDVTVVGCGGTGAAVIAGLPQLHAGMRAYGHGGLRVTVLDGDTVSSANSVRQPFSIHDAGQNKAVLLVTRLNLFWGLTWDAVPRPLTDEDTLEHADLVISCVDTRAARRTIRTITERDACRVTYVLDCGNAATSGQVVLGEPANRARRSRQGQLTRLPCSWELFPELTDAALDENDGPSCSALESLTRQAPFVNQGIATYALALLAQLFCNGEIDRHGGFLDIAAGTTSALPIDRAAWRRLGYPAREAQATRRAA